MVYILLKRVYIEIMNRCNLRCSFCPPSSRPPRVMSAAEFDRLAADVSRHCGYIYLHVKGEPLLHPQLGEVLESADKNRLKVNITTNGVLLPQRAELLLQSPAVRQVNLSLHGYAHDTHGEPEDWLDALCSFAVMAAEQGIFTVFRFWTLDAARRPGGDAARMLALLERRFGLAESLAEQSDRRSITLAKSIFVSFEEQFEWPSPLNDNYGGRGCCYGSRTMLGILADGTVVPCCLDSEGVCSLGNALETPLDELLASERLLAMSRGFEQRRVVEPLCRRCGYRLRFGTE